MVRHARAGDWRRWHGPDRERPLDGRGRRQAEALVGQLAELAVGRVLSSPYLRCMQTVSPLAAARGLEVEPRDELAEGGGRAALRLARELGGGAVMCTHGDVMIDLLDTLAEEDGLELVERYPVKKGSTWVLERAGGRFTEARWLPPPA